MTYVGELVLALMGFLGVLDNNTAYAETEKNILLYDVPFVAQAPFGQWNEIIYQEACEETSILMAVYYFYGFDLTRDIATAQIKYISDLEKDFFGEFRDTSAEDTAKILSFYFNYNNFSLRENVSGDDIIAELERGNLLVVPLDGQKLYNPHFLPPGPNNHMVTVIGYDYNTQEFIVNEPGTQFGKHYRYGKQLFENAMRDYPTGYHQKNEVLNKTMIVIGPENNLFGY